MPNANTQIGSSTELTQKLEEPVLPHSLDISVTFQEHMKSLENHVFEIDDNDYVREIWQYKKDLSGNFSAQDQDHSLDWNEEKRNLLALFYDK